MTSSPMMAPPRPDAPSSKLPPSERASRSTTIRNAHRRAIARNKPPCGICHEEIDYRLPHTDLRSYGVDHCIPIAKGGEDELHNKQAAHRDCNRAKSDHLEMPAAPKVFVTSRTW